MGRKGAVICLMCIFISALNAVKLEENFMLDTIKEWRNYANSRSEINQKCSDQIDEWYRVLKEDILEGFFLQDTWAWRMLDASNKVNPGILNGNTFGTGNMDECLAIDVTHNGTMEIKGKYCYPGIRLRLPPRTKDQQQSAHQINARQAQASMPIDYDIAICIPHECGLLDISKQQVYDDELVDISNLCQTKDTFKEWDGGAWSFIVFVIVIMVLVTASTIYDWYTRERNLKVVHPVTLAFSFYKNSEQLLKLSKNPEQISCMHGIRTLSMMYVMAGHRFSIAIIVAVTNLEQAIEWSEQPYSMYMQGAPLAVDSFLFLTGVLIAYSFMKSQSKPDARFNIFMYYLHRYLRLTPAVAVLWFYYVTFYKYSNSGPLWPMFTNMQIEKCLEYPYSYFLYIQNYINPNDLCMIHTWYLSVDMQLFIISPIILIPMVKYPKYAGYALIGLIILSIIPPILITYLMDIVAYDKNYNEHYYFQPYTRLSPWLVGILLGYIFYQCRDKKFTISKALNLFVWAFTLTFMIVIVYFAREMNLSEDILSFALYSGLHRMFWSVGLMWIVFACHKGYGGIINWFLSLPPFEILGKISYSMYLVHALVQMLIVMNKRVPFHFTQYELMSQCFSDIITVSAISFVYCLMFESPMVVVEKIIFGAPAKPKKEPTQSDAV